MYLTTSPYDPCEIVRANETWWEIKLKKSSPDYTSLAFSWNDTMILHGWLLKDPTYTFPSLKKTSRERASNYTYWESEVVDIHVNVGHKESYFAENEISEDSD